MLIFLHLRFFYQDIIKSIMIFQTRCWKNYFCWFLLVWALGIWKTIMKIWILQSQTPMTQPLFQQVCIQLIFFLNWVIKNIDALRSKYLTNGSVTFHLISTHIIAFHIILTQFSIHIILTHIIFKNISFQNFQKNIYIIIKKYFFIKI